MTTIAAAVFDAIQAHGKPCSKDEVCHVVPYERVSVVSAIHRLSEMHVLALVRDRERGVLYTIAPGATRPSDGRGRPRKA